MENNFKVIGLMSGTSLDGLDVAYCQFHLTDDNWKFEMADADTISYPPAIAESLQNATTLSGLELTILDHQLGKWMGEKVSAFIHERRLTPQLIASHGHTVFHQPEEGFTLQIGNPYEILNLTKIPVVCDFRSFDVVLGGEGAPLVPIGDKLLFGEFDFCLNLGGISNISFDNNGRRLAFDICPVNIVLNDLAQKLGQAFDKDGLLARKGTFNPEIYQALNSLAYYEAPVPKSLGIEWVNKNIFPLLRSFESDIPALLNTFCHHAAFQVGKVVKQFSSGKKQKLLITGGGAFNIYLMELIRKKLPENVEAIVPDTKTVSFKEALIFAFLGLLRWKKQPNILKSVTGAKFDSCGGVIIDNPVFK